MTPPRKFAAKGFVTLLLLAAGCASTIEPTPSPAPPTQQILTTRLMAELTGQLVMVGNCLRVHGAPGQAGDYLLIWPPDIVASVDGDTVQVTDLSLKGQIIWRLGDMVQLGGAGFKSQNDPAQPLPPDCPGPYWLVGGWLDPAATPRPPAAETPALLLVNYSSAPGRFIVQMPTSQALLEMTSTQTIANQLVTCTTVWSQDNNASGQSSTAIFRLKSSAKPPAPRCWTASRTRPSAVAPTSSSTSATSRSMVSIPVVRSSPISTCAMTTGRSMAS
jgi:hypothetical protein